MVRVEVANLLVAFWATCCVVQAQSSINRLDGFELGISRQAAIEKMQALSLTFTTSIRLKDGLEVLHASNGSLGFWVHGDRIVGIRGSEAQFKEKRLRVGDSEIQVRNVMGVPNKEKFIEGGEDVVDVRHLYYKDDRMTLLVALGDGLLRNKSGWAVTSLYLYEDDWL